jgi:hypothetical protein
VVGTEGDAVVTDGAFSRDSRDGRLSVEEARDSA